MTSGTDAKTLAYINMFGVLGGLVALCDIVPEAGKILGRSNVSIGFTIKDGPEATLAFVGGRCSLTEGVTTCDIKLPFTSCEKFNGMINGTVTPIPVKGITKVSFLLGKFKKLADLLTSYLKPTKENMLDDVFMRQSTLVMFRVIVASVAQIANHDAVGRFSASNIVDGVIKIEIAGAAKAALIARDHTLTFCDKVPRSIMSYMSFSDVRTARELFDGKINAVSAVGEGAVRMGGIISQIDNVNRILSRVELYLA